MKKRKGNKQVKRIWARMATDARAQRPLQHMLFDIGNKEKSLPFFVYVPRCDFFLPISLNWKYEIMEEYFALRRAAHNGALA